eukprot:12985838-Heterocapsa_arctica.AAC.1
MGYGKVPPHMSPFMYATLNHSKPMHSQCTHIPPSGPLWAPFFKLQRCRSEGLGCKGNTRYHPDEAI